MAMLVAMTVWGDRVSPVLDSAKNLLVADISAGEVVGRRIEYIEAVLLPRRLLELKQQGVQMLICGAVSQEMAAIVESCDIKLLPFLAGDVDKILEAVVHGRSVSAFAMPGCRCSGRFGGGGNGGCPRRPTDRNR